jgi:hypothetical protein
MAERTCSSLRPEGAFASIPLLKARKWLRSGGQRSHLGAPAGSNRSTCVDARAEKAFTAPQSHNRHQCDARACLAIELVCLPSRSSPVSPIAYGPPDGLRTDHGPFATKLQAIVAEQVRRARRLSNVQLHRVRCLPLCASCKSSRL